MTHTHSETAAQSSRRLWQEQFNSDNHAQLERLQDKLLVAIDETLTPRQRQMLIMYFFRGMCVTQIARELGLCKSSVSRTLTRALEKLGRTLQYSL